MIYIAVDPGPRSSGVVKLDASGGLQAWHVFDNERLLTLLAGPNKRGKVLVCENYCSWGKQNANGDATQRTIGRIIQAWHPFPVVFLHRQRVRTTLLGRIRRGVKSGDPQIADFLLRTNRNPVVQNMGRGHGMQALALLTTYFHLVRSGVLVELEDLETECEHGKEKGSSKNSETSKKRRLEKVPGDESEAFPYAQRRLFA